MDVQERRRRRKEEGSAAVIVIDVHVVPAETHWLHALEYVGIAGAWYYQPTQHKILHSSQPLGRFA
jgi:hypothetical protein